MFSPANLLASIVVAYGIVGLAVLIYVKLKSLRLIRRRRSSEAFGLWAVLSTPFLFPILFLVVLPFWPFVLCYYICMRDDLETDDEDE
jgi:hypothetical protein